MNLTIFTLEKLLKENEEKIANSKKQLRDIEAGVLKVSALKLASVEKTLEEATAKYEEYKKIYDDIPQKEKEAFANMEEIEETLAKQTYYKLQKVRIKHNRHLDRNQKLEIMMLLDELPHNTFFEDDQLVEISEYIIKNNLRTIDEIQNDLSSIRNEFIEQTNKIIDKTDQKYFALLDSYLPILITQFKIFIEELQKSIDEYNQTHDDKKQFVGLPKYEDWWIDELFKNHQAYFALFKWKDIIDKICITEHQQTIWQKLFTNWVNIKKILNTKDENSYQYTYIFDNMLTKYAQLEEEIDLENLASLEHIIDTIYLKEHLEKYKVEHNRRTAYLEFKLENKVEK